MKYKYYDVIIKHVQSAGCLSVRLLASYSEVPQLEVTGLQFLIHQSVWAISLYSYFHALQKYHTA